MRTAKADLPDDIVPSPVSSEFMYAQLPVASFAQVQIVKNLDTDGSGNIDYTEFMAATLTKKQYLRLRDLDAFAIPLKFGIALRHGENRPQARSDVGSFSCLRHQW